MKEQTEQLWNKGNWSITELQEFIANYSNWFQECIIIEKNRVNKDETKKEQKKKGKQKKEDNKDEETGDNEVGKRESNSWATKQLEISFFCQLEI